MPTDSYLPTRDGVSTAVTTTKKALEERGHEVIVIAPDPGREELREEGTVYFKARKFRSYPGYFLPIFPSNKMEVIRGLDVDVIHCQGQMTMAIRAMLVARHLKLPIVTHFHTMVTEAMRYYSPIPLEWNMAERLLWRYFRIILHRSDAVITPTDAVGKELLGRAPHIRRIETIPLGIDQERFNPGLDKSIMRKRHGLEGRKVMVHVSRLSYEKNIELVLRSMTLMDDDTSLLIVGTGPAEPILKKMSSELGLDDRVIFTGFVPNEELALYYAAGDASILASKFETQGLVVIEAMACGLPVAAIDYRALKETVEDGHNGYLFIDDEESCATAMRKCLAADDKMRMNARSTAERFSLDMTCSRLLELYQWAIDSKRERLGGV